MPDLAGGVRHSILDMAPLELDCMNALWPLGEATVRDVHLALAENRPRAYTTIMTILDRLAQKRMVSRRKVGRAWVYTPNISVHEARSRAVSRIVDGFFDGSSEALAAHLTVQADAALSVSGNSAVAMEFVEADGRFASGAERLKTSVTNTEVDASAEADTNLS